MHQRMILEQYTKPKTSLTSTFVIIGAIGVALVFVFLTNITDLKNRKKGFNMVKNGNFEHWANNILIGWKVQKGALVKDKDNPTEGIYSAGIFSDKGDGCGMEQTVVLDPNEIYNISYNMRSSTSTPEAVGVEIIYEGEDVRATTDAAPGIHYHEKGTKWQQYYGRVTGAGSVTLRFFSKGDAIINIDDVGIGVNWAPEKRK